MQRRLEWKFFYLVTDQFHIVRHTGLEGSFVQRIYNLHSSELKYMADNFYTLPPSYLPCDPVDGCDTCYLKYSHKTIINPIKKSFEYFSV